VKHAGLVKGLATGDKNVGDSKSVDQSNESRMSDHNTQESRMEEKS